MLTPNPKTGNIVLEPLVPETEALLAGTIGQLGYPGAEAVTGQVWPQVHQGIDTCLKLARPRTLCRATPFTSLEKKAIRGNGLCLETVNWTRLAARMSEICELCCFAVTLGPDIDKAIKEMGRSDMVRAFMLDAAASILAEQYANQAHQQVRRHYEKAGLQASARFSPGYCDWPIAMGQAAIFAFLEPETIGIHAAATGLMKPRKSVTAAVIAAKAMPEQSPCFLCARQCAHRRAPYAEKQTGMAEG
ncbi:MAG: vitamin B12 dependent-methionine synthase activation domain-containing protein [Thermodesulfobacteriota bacterium]